MANWFAFANRLAKVAYLEEGQAYHPTLVDNGGLVDFGNVDNNSDDVSLSYVDMWGAQLPISVGTLTAISITTTGLPPSPLF